MKTTISKEYIESLSKAVLEASPHELVEFSHALDQHPNGGEITGALVVNLIEKLIEEIFTIPEVEETNNEPSLADVLSEQITAQKLSQQIRDSIQFNEIEPEGLNFFTGYTPPNYFEKETEDCLAKSIKQQVEKVLLSDSIKAQLDAAPVDVSSIIKGQLQAQNLTKTIREQLDQLVEEDRTSDRVYSIEEVIEGILDAIIDEVIEERLSIEKFNLHPGSIALLEMVFSSMFYAKANEMGLPEIVSYDSEYTGYILTDVIEYLANERGYELTFENYEGVLSPVLVP
ncbi:hypothetical protein ABFV99_13860 [Cytobacillus horneckiae]|uniref:hypothetical protein n=1 Tax=Cytobacillus horneckiae TaxID=549687 RepID=UPI0034CEBE51